jgi:membrane carboxypeptidase/penicillin-binding protein
MKFVRRTLLLVLGIVGIVIAGYYGVEIFRARAYTQNVLIPSWTSTSFALPLKDVSDRQIDILLAVEDPAFYHHNGIDLRTPGAGLTTITQALVKILYFESFKPGIAKIKQSLLAVFVLNALISKDDQLQLFFNHCRLGKGTSGFTDAAQRYYGKSFHELTEDEYIALVAMVIAPYTFNVRDYPERNTERTARIKKLLTGDYVPKGLCDLSYGKLDKGIQQQLAPMSYFEKYYKNETY